MKSLQCGINEIDKHLDGFNYGEMVISASRAGHGNFHFLASIARGICYNAKDDPKCLIFTDIAKRNISDMQTGDENIFSFHAFQSKDLKGFKAELEEHTSKKKYRIIIIENTELDISKNKEFYRIIKRSAVENNILIFIKAFLNRKQERRYWYPPTIADIEGSPVLEKLSDKIIIMQRPEILGIKDCTGREQIGMTDLVMFAYDLCTSKDSFIWFDKEKRTFENFDKEKHHTYRYIL